MPVLNPDILKWARESAGLTLEQAVEKLDINDTKNLTAVDHLIEIEKTGDVSRPLLLRMAKQYHRSLLTFYLSSPPRKGDRGQDFRTLPEEYSKNADALLDVLIRDVLVRQHIVHSVLQDDENIEHLTFVGSAKLSDGIPSLVESIRQTIGFRLDEFRNCSSPSDAFSYLRECVETVGVFVILIGNLGSHHTAIEPEFFRGFALADPIAPFVVINEQDTKPAWSFTLMHELAHIWLGATGVSGASTEQSIEKFCNDVAGEFLLPANELAELNIDDSTNFNLAVNLINTFSDARNLSRSMVAYKLYRTKRIAQTTWRNFSQYFRDQWLQERARQKEKDKEKESGPSYYVVRQHRLGIALINLVRRSIGEGLLTPTKAGKILGVKPRNVGALISNALPFQSGGISPERGA